MARETVLVPHDMIVGLAEVAAAIGEKRNTVSNWTNRGSTNGFPPPLVRLAATPIWDMRDIMDWARRQGRIVRR